MSHAVKIFKQMFLHTVRLTRMLSIIILTIIPPIPKALSNFPNILFSKTLTGQKTNQAVIVTPEFAIYFICLASNIASKSGTMCYCENTFLVSSFTFNKYIF